MLQTTEKDRSQFNLSAAMSNNAQKVTEYLADHFSEKAMLNRASVNTGVEAEVFLSRGRSLGELVESIRYSTLQEGGKRFRPILALFVAEALGVDVQHVMPFAAAVECVHTYSLIHDDLPAMDNDDFRRGLPTNHKKFNEATAILAGDALLTEAFTILSEAYQGMPVLAVDAIRLLAQAAGAYGMVGGQVIDMRSKKERIDIQELEILHRMKTGALIEVSVMGAAMLCRASDEQKSDLKIFARQLGLAFQVADDLLDYLPEAIEPGSYPALLGPEKTKEYLHQLTSQCLQALSSWSVAAQPLIEIVHYNQRRLA